MTTKIKIYITSAGFLVAGMLIIVFLIVPSVNKITKIPEELREIKSSLSSLEIEIRELENFNLKYKSYEPALKKTDELFIDPSNPVKFIEFVEKLSISSGLDYEISPLGPVQKPDGGIPWRYSNIYISTKGSWSKTLKFAKGLENGPFLIKIQNINISKGNSEDKTQPTDFTKASFLIKAYIK